MFDFCKKYVSKYKKQLFIYIFFSLTITLITAYTPIIFAKMIDIISVSTNIKALIFLVILATVLSIIKLIISYFNNKLYIIIQANSAVDINADIIQHLHKISLSKLQKMNAGYLNESINRDSNSIVIFFISTITGLISNTILISCSLYVLSHIEIRLTLILLLSIVVYIFIYLLSKKKLKDKAEKQKNAQSIFFSKLLEQFANIKFIKLHSLENLYKTQLKTEFEKFFKVAFSVQQFFFLYTSIDSILEIVTNFCIYVMGGIFVMNGNITLGLFTIIINYYNYMLSAIRYFINFGKDYQENNASYQRLSSYQAIPEQETGVENLSEIDNISCKNILFERNNKIIINHFSYSFKKGKIYYIQGENGTGKTTLIDLLLGMFIGEYTGNIYYNNTNIKQLNMSKLRYEKISVLEQTPYLINGSIADNIHLTELHTNTAFHDKIILKKEPEFYNVENGLSGGERQKIGLLRLLAKNADVLIMDEPTSSLDQLSKEFLYHELHELKKNKIIIIVSHEKDLLPYADEIIQLNLSYK